LVPGSQAPAAKAYEIHLSPPSRVGDRSHIVVDWSQERETTTEHPGAVVDTRREQTALHLDAVATVVATNEAHDATRLTYDVAALTIDGNSIFRGTLDLTRAATVAAATVLSNGEPAAKEVRDALSQAVALRMGATDDQVFGSPEPRVVGARWPIHAKVALEDLAATGVRAGALSGDTALMSVSRVENADYLELRYRMDVTGLEVPGLPPGSVIEGGEASAGGTWVVPVVGTASLHESMEFRMTLKIRVPTPQGDAMVTTTSAERKEGRVAAL
jgi:hypothetical protein